MPALPRLYARALRQSVGTRRRLPTPAVGAASGWSTDPVRVKAVRLSEARLRAYRQVCGFAESDTVPATYPQLLAFPLQLLVLTSPGFPFPALGAVHIANLIEQHEELQPGATLDLAVHATDLREHRRGRQVTVVIEARLAGREVWRARSDYLRIEQPGPPSEATPGTPEPYVETASKTPVSWELGADLGRRYAAVSGDRNPIHLYDLTARPFGFRHHIAHGMWTLARCLAQLQPDVPSRMRCDVTFRRPVPLPGSVEFTASGTDGRTDFAVGSASAPDRHLVGRLVAT
jgi:acyl dehydratase